jgi:LacI family transcriptional regulator
MVPRGIISVHSQTVGGFHLRPPLAFPLMFAIPTVAAGWKKMPSKSKFRVLLVFRRPSADTGAMLRGIAKYQRLHGQWSVFVDDDTGFECRSEHLWEREWDGVICAHTTPSLVKTCAERKVPLVDLTDGPCFSGVPQVRPDNVAVGHMAAEDLVERGYTNFAFCGFSNELWSTERRNGFIEGLALVGKSCTVFESEGTCRYSPEWCGHQLQRITNWLKQQPLPLALMACHDHRAVQVMDAAKLCGLSVPEDIVVLGVNDDRACCEMAQPLLSSIALDSGQAGYLAAENLASLMSGESLLRANTSVGPIGVVTRQSTDMLALEDRRLSAALRYIRDNACRGITVEEVVRRTAVPRHELERGLRRHIGRSPQAEIRRIQMAEIKRLLQHTDNPLKDIAEHTGFEYVEYMCVVFKRLVGKTPGKFRKDTRSGSAPMVNDVLNGAEDHELGLAAAGI